MRSIFTFCLLILFTLNSFSQVKISGVVRSGNQFITGANVYLKGTYDGTSTDANGKYTFQTEEKGEQILVVTFMGYQPQEKKIIIENSPVQIDINLKEKANELNTVQVVAGTFEASDAKKAVVLNSLDIATTAGAQADIFSALQTLPGTQAASESEGLFVRGGSASEAKTYFDGMMIQKPFGSDLPNIAQRGRFSPFMFKGTTFSAGGYSAIYGQALSSALILDSKDIAEKSTTDIGIMTVGGSLGHTHRFKNSSLNVMGAYYNLTPAFRINKQNIDWDHEPTSEYGSSTYRLKTSKTGLLKMYAEYSHDQTSFFYKNIENVSSNDNWLSNEDHSFLSNATYQEFLGPNLKLNAGLAFSNDDNNVLLDTNVYHNIDQLMQARVMLTDYFGQLSSVKIGGEIFKQRREEKYNVFERNFDEHLSAVFAEGDLFFTNKWVARLGTRFEYSDLLDQFSIAPRTSLAYKTGKYSQTSVAYGKFYQTPGDEYLIQQSDLDFENADHYILNFQHLSERYTFRIEAYYKNYDRLIKNDEDSTVLFNNSGSGYAQGFDIFWRDRKTLKRADYWVSYSFLDTKRNYKDYSEIAIPTFAAKHTMNVVYKQFFVKLHTQISATYTFASGRTYYNPNNPDFLSDYTKAYHNLSLSVSYLTTVFKNFTVIYASFGNIPGFNNVYGYQYSNDGSRRNAIIPSEKRSVFVGMFISIGDDNILN
jgi:hypothetical protein